jgi:hypothetical protein
MRMLISGRCTENGETNFPPSPPHGLLHICCTDNGTACLFSKPISRRSPFTPRNSPHQVRSQLPRVASVRQANRPCQKHAFHSAHIRPVQGPSEGKTQRFLTTFLQTNLMQSKQRSRFLSQFRSLSNSTCHLDFPTRLPDSKLVRILTNHSSSQPSPLLFGSSGAHSHSSFFPEFNFTSHNTGHNTAPKSNFPSTLKHSRFELYQVNSVPAFHTIGQNEPTQTKILIYPQPHLPFFVLSRIGLQEELAPALHIHQNKRPGAHFEKQRSIKLKA